MKLKNIWGVSGLMLVGVATSVPITLTTSCVEKKDWTFNSLNDVDNYWKKHEQGVSESYLFGYETYQDDCIFIKNNVNLQLFINSALYLALTVIPKQPIKSSGLELHIKNKTTAEIDCKVSAGVEPMVRDSKSAEDTTINRKTIISYDNFIVSVKTYNNGTLGDSGSFDLSKGPSQKHQVTAYFDNNLRGLQAAFIGFPRQLSFFDETTMQYEFTMPLNGYDWTNHIVMGETDTGEKIY